MNYKIAVLLLFSVLMVKAQGKLQISSAKVDFVFVNNDVEGSLTGFSSQSTVDLDQIENSKLKGSVQVETISTGNSIRNWSLRRSKYFDAENYPTISFESTSVQQKGTTISVKGALTIKDVTKEVTFLFERNDKKLVGKTTLYSSDYGINIKKERAKNQVLVQLEFQLK